MHGNENEEKIGWVFMDDLHALILQSGRYLIREKISFDVLRALTFFYYIGYK